MSLLAGIAQSVQQLVWTGRSGDQIPVVARFSVPVQAVPGAHLGFYTMGTVYLSGVNVRSVALTTHPINRRGYRKRRAATLFPVWTFMTCLCVLNCLFCNLIARFLKLLVTPANEIHPFVVLQDGCIDKNQTVLPSTRS